MKFKTIDEFKAFLKECMKEEMETGTISDVVRKAVADALDNLQKTTTPVQLGGRDFEGIVGYERRGTQLYFADGSIIDTENKKAPWVRVGETTKTWMSEFMEYLNKGVVGKTLQESSDPEGGYLVPEAFRATMVMYDAEPAIVWPRATVWPMTTDKLGMPKLAQRPDVTDSAFDHFAGVDFSWTDEGGTKTETEPTFEFIELIVHELSGYTAITNILMDDAAINIMNFLTTLFRSAYVWITDKSFIQGDGAKKPLGVINDPNVLTVTRASANDISPDDIINMEAKLPSVFDAGAVWFMTKQGRAKVRGKKATSGEYLLQEDYKMFADGYIGYMLGIPVVLADGKLPSVGTKGDVILGNWKWYYIGDRQEFRLDQSRHYLFRSNKTAIRVCGRIDGQPAISEAFVVLV